MITPPLKEFNQMSTLEIILYVLMSLGLVAYITISIIKAKNKKKKKKEQIEMEEEFQKEQDK